MDFTFTPDQEQLRDAVRRLATGGGEPAAIWRAATEQLGLPAIGIRESFGGAGGDFVDAAVVIEEAGRALLPVPLTTSLVAGAVLDRAGEAGSSYAAAVAAGESVAVLAVDGALDHVLDGDRADVFLLAGPDTVSVVVRDDAGVDVHPVVTLDPTRGQARLRLTDDASPSRIGDAADARAAVDLLRVALAVEAVGAARACLELTVAHLKTREQFGRPIGSFQALQHRAADLVVALESAASSAYYAAWAAAAAPDELAVVAPLAMSVCAEAAWRIAAETIQLHGGIGFTWEHPAHRYFKRLTTTRLVLGAPHEQRRLVGERAGLLR